MQSEPHFAGLINAIAEAPGALLGPGFRRLAIAIQVTIVAGYAMPYRSNLPDLIALAYGLTHLWFGSRRCLSFGALHFWHSVLLTYDLWAHENPIVQSSKLHILLLLLVLIPFGLIFLAVLCIVLFALNSTNSVRTQTRHGKAHQSELLDAILVRRHVRCITVILLLAPMDIELIALLPWTGQAYAGFPSRRVLVIFVVSALLQKSSLIILGAYFIAIE